MRASRWSPVLLTVTALLATPPGDAAGFSLFTIREPVFAVVDGMLLAGEALGHWDRTGTMSVHSTLDEALHCEGSFRFTGLKSGTAQIRCSDGSELDLNFEALGALSGWGQGLTSRGPVSFTFGLSAAEATPYLNLPKGKRIILTALGPKLQDG